MIYLYSYSVIKSICKQALNSQLFSNCESTRISNVKYHLSTIGDKVVA